jgi:hypothetical protein
MTECVDIVVGRWTQADANRIAAILRVLGWKRLRKREGSTRSLSIGRIPMLPSSPARAKRSSRYDRAAKPAIFSSLCGHTGQTALLFRSPRLID